MRKLLTCVGAAAFLWACSPETSHPKDSKPMTSHFITQQTGPSHIFPKDTDSIATAPTLPTREPWPAAALLGQIKQHQDTDFVRIASQYTRKSNIYLRKAAYEAWEAMHAAAQTDGIHLEIISATRNFNYQKGIWERKWTGATKVKGQNLAQTHPDPVKRATTILQYSSMPGTSRHHWGTDIDLNNLNNEWFETGTGKKTYAWLTQHAHEYGYCQTYTPIGELRPKGYQEEKWHWSYMPLAKEFLEDYLYTITYGHLTGFKGVEAAEHIDVIRHYVGGINPACH